MIDDFHRTKRLPPYVFAEVNRLKASARTAGAVRWWRSWWPELAIVVLAALVRFWRLDYHSFWFDEAVSLDWIGMKVTPKFLRNAKLKPTDVYFFPA